MTGKIITALIAAAVSLIVSMFSYWSLRKKIASEEKRHALDHKRKLAEKLLDLRLQSYPKAFEITDRLRGDIIKKGGDNTTPAYIELTLDLLHTWHRESAGFLLTKESLHAYRALRSALQIPPAKDQAYSKEQRLQMFRCKNRFRGTLKSDLNLLYIEESVETDDGINSSTLDM